jgi:Co/Zn/Cd efflux system component
MRRKREATTTKKMNKDTIYLPRAVDIEQLEAKQNKARQEYKKNITKLIIMMVMVFIVMLAELGVGIGANSLALLSDAFHMLSDFMGLIIGAVAMTVRSLLYANKSSSHENQRVTQCRMDGEELKR